MTRYEVNRTIRILLDLSGRELAERVEVTKQTISNYERGRCHSRPTERVIEIELDLAIENCTDDVAKSMCHTLKLMREDLAQ